MRGCVSLSGRIGKCGRRSRSWKNCRRLHTANGYRPPREVRIEYLKLQEAAYYNRTQIPQSGSAEAGQSSITPAFSHFVTSRDGHRARPPDNRLVARGLEAEWERALRAQSDAAAELSRRENAPPGPSPPASGQRSWRSATTSNSSGTRRPLPTSTASKVLRTLLEEVNITVRRDAPDPHAALILRWKGGAVIEMTVPLRRPQPKIRTGEDTVGLIRRLAVHYPDAVIAGTLNRQHRTTARGMSFTADRAWTGFDGAAQVAQLRRHAEREEDRRGRVPDHQRRRRRSGHPGRLDPEPPGDRKLSSLGEGRDLPGGQIAGQDRKRAPRDGLAAEPGHEPDRTHR